MIDKLRYTNIKSINILNNYTPKTLSANIINNYYDSSFDNMIMNSNLENKIPIK